MTIDIQTTAQLDQRINGLREQLRKIEDDMPTATAAMEAALIEDKPLDKPRAKVMQLKIDAEAIQVAIDRLEGMRTEVRVRESTAQLSDVYSRIAALNDDIAPVADQVEQLLQQLRPFQDKLDGLVKQRDGLLTHANDIASELRIRYGVDVETVETIIAEVSSQ